MTRALSLANRHPAHPVDLRRLRRLLHTLLTDQCQLEQFDLGVCLLDDPQMIELNETFLKHAGSTDVITFDYTLGVAAGTRPELLHGEIYICLDEAVLQARRFRTSWQSELARYAVHGVLHLLGYDDLRAAPRREMKRLENLHLRQLSRQYSLAQLQLQARR